MQRALFNAYQYQGWLFEAWTTIRQQNKGLNRQRRLIRRLQAEQSELKRLKMSQESLMLYDPATNEPHPYPSQAAQWRTFNGLKAWLYNPWTGTQRNAEDVGSDPTGLLILPPGENLEALCNFGKCV